MAEGGGMGGGDAKPSINPQKPKNSKILMF